MAQTDILSAIRQIAAERKIDVEDILITIKEGIKTSYQEEKGIYNLDVIIDPEKGQIAVFNNKDVVKKVMDPETEISLEDAKAIKPKIKEGETLAIDITADGDFGRIAAQSARQVILQGLRESEKAAVIRQFTGKVGSIISVIVQRILPEGDILCEVNKARAIMPRADRIPNEFYRLGNPIKVVLKDIKEDVRGKYMEVSRADNMFLHELFKMEVPEIESGSVEIVSMAREAGSRSKVAVKSNASGVDPIGSCVGQKGVRINAISNELKSGDHEEKIDIILWDDNVETFLMNSIRPAESVKVKLIDDKKEKKATIIVPDDQYSLAIGREGQNVRLSAKLTGWNIDIQSLSESEGKAPVARTVQPVASTESEESKKVSEESNEQE